jgi:hypothetical protein
VAEDKTNEEGETADRLITGHVLIPAAVPSFDGATAHVRLEELSGEDDRGASVRAEAVVPDLRHEPAGDEGGADTLVPFTIRVAAGELVIDPRNDYAVRVWIDHDSDGRKGPDDLYSDERHPVFTGGTPRPLLIKVVRR